MAPLSQSLATFFTASFDLVAPVATDGVYNSKAADAFRRIPDIGGFERPQIPDIQIAAKS